MVFEKVCALMSEQLGVDKDTITMRTTFDDLNADSLDVVELMMAIEEEFNVGEIEDNTIQNINTVGDVVAYIKERME